ncbi:MAG TPA: hypothetical protein VJ397_05270 [Thermoplasmata archaeon]|nr:hypothetical protein [Thermoplasmata archaeon]
MPLITVRVDDETKKAMASLPDVNWSEIIRHTIVGHVENRKRQNRVEALLIMERISARVKVPKGYDSTKIIRYWRDRRYGKGRH